MNKKRLPPLNWLRSFEVSARHLNFTQAATELNLTQAAISQQVKGLETQLGTPLFKRLPRGLELTDAGKAYLPPVRDAVESLVAVTDELFGQGFTKALTIKVNLVFFTRWLVPRLEQFRALHPEVGLRFTSNIWVDERKWDADLEIRYGLGAWPGLKAERLTWDKLLPVCSPTLVGGGSLPTSPEELVGQTLLHVIGYKEGWSYWLGQTGFAHLETSPGIRFDTLISALEMATQGHGIALGRTSLVSDMLADGRLVAPFPQQVETQEAFYLTYPEHQYVHPHAETFRAWIVGEAESGHD
ncbi:transcriptional regulator [Marinobacterium nitratireducens]|uniref:Transcriptional regulator n=1 Tax=Marinobacterium nitratireducens TaxID=518897 RepID=A0A918DTE0_9GAMM|nr:transcriptional regulator GcvA [Marinobacterium nitratireducens]GGO81958.1 transcriptional regulator [Marinobacterium nitratireducens]